MFDGLLQPNENEERSLFQRTETWVLMGSVLGAASVACYAVGRRIEAAEGVYDAEYEED
jgi:hypothetical protein